MSPCRTCYFLVLFLKPWPQAGLCTRPHLLCSKLNVTRYEEELVAGVRFKNQTEVWSQNTYHDCLCLQTKSCKAILGYYNSSESPHQGKGDSRERENSDYETLSMENETGSNRMRKQRGCAAGISPANSFSEATNQSVLCESRFTTCVCSGKTASAGSIGARSKWIAVQANTSTEVDLESISPLIYLSSFFSLFNEHFC